MKLFIPIPHPEKEDFRLFIVATPSMPPDVLHFYLERRPERSGPWIRSRKVKRDFLTKYAKRFGFDMLELAFTLEEKAEEAME